jgi:trigger factor
VEVTVESVSETRKKAVVSVPAEAIAEEEKAVLAGITSQAKMPGFRPGKAPENMVRRRYAKELADELNRRMTSKAYEAVQSDSGLKIHAVVGLEGNTYVPGEASETSFTLDVQPDFELPAYEGLEVTIQPSTATDEEIDHAIEHLRRERASFNPVERAAANGDYVKLSYEGTLEGQPIAELVPDYPILGSQQATWEEAGSTESPGVQAVIQGLIGMAAGDTKTVEEAFPEDFPIEALQGKTGTYAIEVFEVRERELPPLDETFLKSFEVETEEGLRQRIKEDIERQKSESNEQAKRSQVADQLTAAVSFAVPESALERETQQLLADYMSRQMQQGATEEQFEAQKDELHAQARQAAENRVRTQFILFRIAEAEEVKVENEDVNRAITYQAMRSRQRPEDIVKELQNNRERLHELQRGILLQKTLDLVVEKAAITEQEPRAAAPAQ